MKLSEIKVSYSYTSNKIQISGSHSVYQLIIENWNLGTIQLYEEFKILLLNRNNSVLGIYQISKGGVAGTVVDPKIIFSVALKSLASSIILVHNHPSSNLKPSAADIKITKQLKEAGKLLDIQVLDHLIITAESYFSFADERMI